MFAIKCGTPSGVIGFDFEFYPMTGVIVERARYPIRKGSESDFQAAHRSNVEFANVHEVSGGNRWRWFVKWAHSSQPDVLVQGDLPQELRCEN